MRLFDLFENDNGVMYHVTSTANVDKIKQKGILPLQTSNWVKGGPDGERYGEGGIFAFEHKNDALRWAGKMDWDFNKTFGSGNISIIEFVSDENPWDTDVADPIGQAGATGKWLKRQRHVPATQIKAANPVTVEMIRSARL